MTSVRALVDTPLLRDWMASSHTELERCDRTRRRRMNPEGEFSSPPRRSQPAGIESRKAPVNGKSGADERAVRERCSEPPDPEPYAVSREAGGGAMARARIGWVLSSVIAIVGGADAVKTGGRQDSARRYARWAGTSRSRRPHACAEPPFAGTGRSFSPPTAGGAMGRSGKPIGVRR